MCGHGHQSNSWSWRQTRTGDKSLAFCHRKRLTGSIKMRKLWPPSSLSVFAIEWLDLVGQLIRRRKRRGRKQTTKRIQKSQLQVLFESTSVGSGIKDVCSWSGSSLVLKRSFENQVQRPKVLALGHTTTDRFTVSFAICLFLRPQRKTINLQVTGGKTTLQVALEQVDFRVQLRWDPTDKLTSGGVPPRAISAYSNGLSNIFPVVIVWKVLANRTISSLSKWIERREHEHIA